MSQDQKIDQEALEHALACMTIKEDGVKGCYWKCINTITGNFVIGKLYQQQQDSINTVNCFLDKAGERNGFYPRNREYFRKATKEEILNHFRLEEAIPVTYTSLPEDIDAASGLSGGGGLTGSILVSEATKWEPKCGDVVLALHNEKYVDRIFLSNSPDGKFVCVTEYGEIDFKNSLGKEFVCYKYSVVREKKPQHKITKDEAIAAWCKEKGIEEYLVSIV